MPDVVEAVRVPLDGGRIGIVEGLGQHLGCVVPDGTVHIVRLGQRGVPVGQQLGTAGIVPAVERGLSLRLLAVGVILGGQGRVLIRVGSVTR